MDSRREKSLTESEVSFSFQRKMNWHYSPVSLSLSLSPPNSRTFSSIISFICICHNNYIYVLSIHFPVEVFYFFHIPTSYIHTSQPHSSPRSLQSFPCINFPSVSFIRHSINLATVCSGLSLLSLFPLLCSITIPSVIPSMLFFTSSMIFSIFIAFRFHILLFLSYVLLRFFNP